MDVPGLAYFRCDALVLLAPAQPHSPLSVHTIDRAPSLRCTRGPKTFLILSPPDRQCGRSVMDSRGDLIHPIAFRSG